MRDLKVKKLGYIVAIKENKLQLFNQKEELIIENLTETEVEKLGEFLIVKNIIFKMPHPAFAFLEESKVFQCCNWFGKKYPKTYEEICEILKYLEASKKFTSRYYGYLIIGFIEDR